MAVSHRVFGRRTNPVLGLPKRNHRVTSSVEAGAGADNVDPRFSIARGQPYRKGVPLSLSQTWDTNSGAFILGTTSS